MISKWHVKQSTVHSDFLSFTSCRFSILRLHRGYIYITFHCHRLLRLLLTVTFAQTFICFGDLGSFEEHWPGLLSDAPLVSCVIRLGQGDKFWRKTQDVQPISFTARGFLPLWTLFQVQECRSSRRQLEPRAPPRAADLPQRGGRPGPDRKAF